MYRTLGNSLFPVICVASRSRRSLAVLLRAAAGAVGLLAAGLEALAVLPGAAGVGVPVGEAGGADEGAEVFTPGSMASRDSAGSGASCGGAWASAAADNSSNAQSSSLVMFSLLVAVTPGRPRHRAPALPARRLRVSARPRGCAT